MELVLNILKIILSIICVFAVLASKLKLSNWWIRVFDFPRIQLLIMATLAVALYVFPYLSFEALNITGFLLVVFSWFYQARKIFPYTLMAKKEVKKIKRPLPKMKLESW